MADGVLGAAAGAAFLAVRRAALDRWVVLLTRDELAEDPTDFLASHLRAWAAHLGADARTAVAAYLIAHGTLSVVLGVNVLKGRLWAYRWAGALLAAFTLYLAYRVGRERSPALALLCAWDLAILILLAWEFRLHARRRAAAG